MGCGSSAPKGGSSRKTSAPEAVSFSVMCPPKAKPGQKIIAHINGHDMEVVIPSTAVPGQVFRFTPEQPKPPASPKKQSGKNKESRLEGAFERDNSIIRDSFFEVDGVGADVDDEDFNVHRGETSGSIDESPPAPAVSPPKPEAQAPSPKPVSAPTTPHASTSSPAPAPAPSSSSVRATSPAVSTPATSTKSVPPSAPAITSATPGSVVQVTVPAGVSSGQEFHVTVNGTRLSIKCPPNARPGSVLGVQVPGTPTPAPATAAAPAPAPVVVNTPQLIHVTIPQGVPPGGTFEVIANGQRMVVPCPPGYGPGSVIAVQAPAAAATAAVAAAPPAAPPATIPLDVIVPAGVGPGQQFQVQYNGLKIGVMCPPGVTTGQQIRIQIPRQ